MVTKKLTRKANIGLLQEHAGKGAEVVHMAGCGSICLLDRAVRWRRCELCHWFEVAVGC